MAQAQSTVSINRPADVVYEFLADGLNDPQWREGVVSIELKAGQPATAGAEHRQVLKGPGGRRIDGDYRLTTADPARQLAFVVTTGPARPTGIYRLTADGDGRTEVTSSLEYTSTGLKKLIGPMIQKTMQSEVGSLTALKRVLEQS